MGLKYDARLDLSALSDALEKRGLTPGGRVQKAVDEAGFFDRIAAGFRWLFGLA